MSYISRYSVKTPQTGIDDVIKFYKQKHGEPPRQSTTRQSTSSKNPKGGKNKKPKPKPKPKAKAKR